MVDAGMSNTGVRVKKTKEKPLLKLDLGCGEHKREGFTGVDRSKLKGVDQVVDLSKYPWPWKDGSVAEVHCSHFFEHIPGMQRPRFMDELYRILAPAAKVTIIVPYGNSDRAVQDYTHQWPPVVAESFLYFNKEWRTKNGLTHGDYAMKCDFDFGYGYALDPTIATRSQDVQQFSLRHYKNAASDLQVTLTKK